MASAHHAKAIKPVDPHVLRLEVLGSEQMSPSIRRLTVGGAALAQFTPLGFDQWFRLFLPRADQHEFRLPTRTSTLWYAQWLATPSSQRPDCRNYTVAAVRPALNEMDIDFVVHTNHDSGLVDGIAAAWALNAQPGQAIGLLDQGIMFNQHPATSSSLLVADESGLPAVEGVLRSLARDALGTAVIEVPDAGDRRPLGEPTGYDVQWVVRTEAAEPHATPGVAALARVVSMPSLSPESYVFVVGESALATGVRRHAVGQGVPKDQVRFTGYWKAGVRAGSVG